MRIVVIAHPAFLRSKSMPLFAEMLARHFQAQAIISPKAYFYRVRVFPKLRKWLGYIDQYVIFPFVLRYQAKKFDSHTLFVFSDQALGPWVPILKDRLHVVHCHDLLALRSALGEFPENPTSFSGRIYQKYIKWGFSKGKNFISVSNQSRDDLHRLASLKPERSVTVYNGLNYDFKPVERSLCINILRSKGLPVDSRGMILHVGGSQWYKNRLGVVRLYSAYASSVSQPLPLWMVGPTDQREVLDAINSVPPSGKVHLLSGLDSEALCAAYSLASLFLFPSLEEGFGWPIAEAQACGTPVITTARAPMTEVGGDAAIYLPRMPQEDIVSWATAGAKVIDHVIKLSVEDRKIIVEKGIKNSARFSASESINAYLKIYEDIVSNGSVAQSSRKLPRQADS